MTGTRIATAALLVAGCATTLAARSFAWHHYEQSGFTSPPPSFDLFVVALAAVLAAAGLAQFVVVRAGLQQGAQILAISLAAMLVAGLLIIGDDSHSPDTGAWLAGLSVVLLASSGVPALPTRAIRIAVMACVVGAAVSAVVLPADAPTPQEIEIIP
jgi:hypothetical protein